MNKNGKIPTINPSNMTGFHSHTIDWKPVLSNTKHPFFHINRLETVVNQLNFPLPPHRKSLYDFLLLKKGTSKRSKGLNGYEFGESSMFFLPAYQITQQYKNALVKQIYQKQTITEYALILNISPNYLNK
jgi:hypothetical protein